MILESGTPGGGDGGSLTCLSDISSQLTGLMDVLCSPWPPLRCVSFILVLGITFVSDVQFTPHYDFQFLSLLQDLFWAMDFQPCLYFAKIARELLAASTSL